jgi:hypothetical protein
VAEISDKMKRRYLDKAVQQRYDRFGQSADDAPESWRKKWMTPTGKIKKAWWDTDEYKRGAKRDARRGEIIDKTATDVTGKPPYSKMSTMKEPAVHGQASDWHRGKKYSNEDKVNEISDKKLDAYREKAFRDQPAGDDGSEKYRKRSKGRAMAFDKQTGRGRVAATKEGAQVNEYKPGVTVLKREISFADLADTEFDGQYDPDHEYATVKRIRWPYGIEVSFDDKSRTVRFKTAKMKTVARILEKHIDFGATSAAEVLDLPRELMQSKTNEAEVGDRVKYRNINKAKRMMRRGFSAEEAAKEHGVRVSDLAEKG